MSRGLKVLCIGDTQVRPNISLDYLSVIGKYIADKRPDVIVHIGDHFDFPSLSSYDKGKKSFEGRRIKDDLEAGINGMRMLLNPLFELQDRQRQNKKKVYRPEMHFCGGNHDFSRLDRLIENTPELDGIVSRDLLQLEDFGWTVHDFLRPVEIQGIFFSHYLSNPFTGKPYGGNALTQLKTVGRSFVVGHKQLLDIAIRPTLDGKHQIGIINGASYIHNEDYKGYTGNNHFRGVIMLHEVKDGFGLPMPVSLDYLMQKYGDNNE